MAPPLPLPPPPSLLLLLLLLLAAVAPSRAVLALPSVLLCGYNTFSAYPDPQNLNASFLLDIIGRLGASPLRRFGYSVEIFWVGRVVEDDAERDGRAPSSTSTATAAPCRRRSASQRARCRRPPPPPRRRACSSGSGRCAACTRTPRRGACRAEGMEQYTLDQLVDTEPLGGGSKAVLVEPIVAGRERVAPGRAGVLRVGPRELVELGSEVIEAMDDVVGPATRTRCA
jgi:hypothetical protein